MNLQQLFEALVTRGEIRGSRIAPIKTSIKVYSGMLGHKRADQCPVEAYNKPPLFRKQLIERMAAPNLGLYAVRNLKNNIGFVLRKGIESRLIPALETGPSSWKQSRSLNKKAWKYTRRKEFKVIPLQRLNPLPEKFAAELAEYERWSVDPVELTRPARIKKRPSTMISTKQSLWIMASFLVNIQGKDPDSLTLAVLVEPANMRDFVRWWMNFHKIYTRTLATYLQKLEILDKYYVKSGEGVNAIREIRASLGQVETVWDKKERWVSLSEIERAGISWYPFNSVRASEIRRPSPASQRFYASWAQRSLLLRLLVRIPFRQRNIREMQLEKNLLKEEGRWVIKFKGTELKVARRRGRPNEVKYDFPSDLVPLLEEWLTKWRPLLVQGRTHNFVFVTVKGDPTDVYVIRRWVKYGTYKFLGVGVNPHLIRDIWATEYLKSEQGRGDIATAAYMLGDKVETILNHYAHLLDQDAEVRAQRWLNEKFGSQVNGDFH
jgi:integrase